MPKRKFQSFETADSSLAMHGCNFASPIWQGLLCMYFGMEEARHLTSTKSRQEEQ